MPLSVCFFIFISISASASSTFRFQYQSKEMHVCYAVWPKWRECDFLCFDFFSPAGRLCYSFVLMYGCNMRYRVECGKQYAIHTFRTFFHLSMSHVLVAICLLRAWPSARKPTPMLTWCVCVWCARETNISLVIQNAYTKCRCKWLNF